MVTIGVLALQGAVKEHIRMIEVSGACAVEVKRPEQLADVDGLILPGGESTTMRKLIDKYSFFEPLVQFGAAGKPVFGTCAGMILMARELTEQKDGHLGYMDMTVERNAFGRQRESFEADVSVKGIANDVRAVFIRAPLVKRVGDDVEVLAMFNEEMVAVRQGSFLACSFHPELTNDHRLHQFFIDMCKKHDVRAQ
ncbi:pyridoxal 5'-phosphate synthase glutaminase subunit PdxT [Shouchella lonarensis]|uniref:Pyridoxal 5'-phosphate synthase subunit PdxT n=1 Tax=Shouchella lonarensis TaxID=1464122 RepID=A0A1G6LW56_9BACI|nr:pyridoxal 5'-phosphate synthase glutaminase subunit PdxT [Shouchella lonarensis]SDC46965.1 pyridoxal phosphate synthase yaaE subunit [Shouchella lonarensis]